MNNYETKCYELWKDLLNNRPKDQDGRIVLYDDETRNKYFATIKTNQQELQKEAAISEACRETLLVLYGAMNEILTRRLV